MESHYITYDVAKSAERIDNILKENDRSFEELNEIPSRSKLTFTNGFYVNCSAIFVDIRGSSDLTDNHKRPKLAKLYRSFISEVVAIMNGEASCAEVNINGDCVWGVFKTPSKRDINLVFSIAAQVASLIYILNYKFKKNGIEEITVGIGMDYGRALMVKAGYNGSTINDVVWMGDVVNQASNLCGYAECTYNNKQMMVSNVFYNNLNNENQTLLSKNYIHDCYHGDVINIFMEKWYKENCK